MCKYTQFKHTGEDDIMRLICMFIYVNFAMCNVNDNMKGFMWHLPYS